MTKLPSVKTKQLVAILVKLGFVKHHQVGNHAQFKHPDGRRTTIAIHSGRDIPKGTLRAILKDADIEPEEFLRFVRK